MGLKQDIIVVNEFSVPLPGGKGSRGATPGQYVERYMAREQATESLAPIQRLRTDGFVMRYMARESAVERSRHLAGRGEDGDAPGPGHRRRGLRLRLGLALRRAAQGRLEGPPEAFREREDRAQDGTFVRRGVLEEARHRRPGLLLRDAWRLPRPHRPDEAAHGDHAWPGADERGYERFRRSALRRGHPGRHRARALPSGDGRRRSGAGDEERYPARQAPGPAQDQAPPRRRRLARREAGGRPPLQRRRLRTTQRHHFHQAVGARTDPGRILAAVSARLSRRRTVSCGAARTTLECARRTGW